MKSSLKRWRQRGLLLAVGLLTNSLTLSADTLAEVIAQVLSEHPDILTSRANLSASLEGEQAAKSGYFPTLSLSLGAGHERSDSPATRLSGDKVDLTRQEASLMLRQPLYDGGRMFAAVDREQAFVLSRRYQLHESELMVVMQAIEAYLLVLRHQTELELVKENLVVHQKIHGQIRARVEGGAGTEADLKQTEARLALSRTRLLMTESALADAKFRYRKVVGTLPNTLEPLPMIDSELLQQPLAQLLEQRLPHHPSLQRAASEVIVAQMDVALGDAPLLPQLNLELSATRHNNIDGTEGVNGDQLAMVRLNYALATGGGDFARKRRAKALLQGSREQLEKQRRDLEERLSITHNLWQSSRAQLTFLQSHVDSSREVRRAYQQQFAVGRRSLLDLLDAENELFTARQALIRGDFQLQQSRFRLLGLLQQLDELLPPALSE
ncbi:type I secretion protein TolC [Ectothiorhodospiraceae bacterium BW-2]|nr:type I secretion protein TolC [Ectothiorhodospiraceae bacterium BW-2]